MVIFRSAYLASPSSRKTKLNYMNKQCQVKWENVLPTFIGMKFKYDINGTEMHKSDIFCAVSLAVELFESGIFLSMEKFGIRKVWINLSHLCPITYERTCKCCEYSVKEYDWYTILRKVFLEDMKSNSKENRRPLNSGTFLSQKYRIQ